MYLYIVASMQIIYTCMYMYLRVLARQKRSKGQVCQLGAIPPYNLAL